MDCVNHSGVAAAAYCQNCGKALCQNCVRQVPGGLILCEPCWANWQRLQQSFPAAQAGSPNPWVAAGIGVLPGVGAMYNGQFIKGLIHVVIFAVLVSAAHVYGIFGLFVGAWIVYQSFEAYHTARALRDGQPPPDPLGLNELGGWMGAGGRPTPAPPANPEPGAAGSAQTASGGTAGAGPYQAANPGAYQGAYQGPFQGPYQTPYCGPRGPFGEEVPPGPPPQMWRRREPIGAIVLIGLGVLFLLGQLNIFTGRMFEFSWPVLLIGLGVWLMIRRIGEGRGGSR